MIYFLTGSWPRNADKFIFANLCFLLSSTNVDDMVVILKGQWGISPETDCGGSETDFE